MLSNNPNESQTSQLRDAKAGTAQPSATVLDPRSPIEVASTGTGTGNDPIGTDNRPPGVYDADSLA
jgi:hypothetical protein